MSRALWFVTGSAAGMYALVKARRTLHAFTPDGIGARAAALGAGARVFADQVSEGMAEREQQLLKQLALSGPDRLLIEKRADPPLSDNSDLPARSAAPPEGGGDGHR